MFFFLLNDHTTTCITCRFTLGVKSVFINKQNVLLTCRKLESPLRCMAKTIYPYCAAKGADVTDWLKKFLPHMKMTSMNMMDIDTSKFEFKEPKV